MEHLFQKKNIFLKIFWKMTRSDPDKIILFLAERERELNQDCPLPSEVMSKLFCMQIRRCRSLVQVD